MNASPTPKSAQWPPLNLEDWMDDNCFSPMHPPANFSPSFWVTSTDQNQQSHLTGVASDPRTEMDSFPNQLFSNDDIFSAPAFPASGHWPVQDIRIDSEIIRLQGVVDRLSASLKALRSGLSAIQDDHAALKVWANEVATTVNDLQSKRGGLPALRKNCGLVLGPKYVKDESGAGSAARPAASGN